MKVYVTKYALTKGVQEVHARDVGDGVIALHGKFTIYVYKPHWHKTKSAAIKQAEKMRIAKIQSLKKQIAKLEKMTFSGDT